MLSHLFLWFAFGVVGFQSTIFENLKVAWASCFGGTQKCNPSKGVSHAKSLQRSKNASHYISWNLTSCGNNYYDIQSNDPQYWPYGWTTLVSSSNDILSLKIVQLDHIHPCIIFNYTNHLSSSKVQYFIPHITALHPFWNILASFKIHPSLPLRGGLLEIPNFHEIPHWPPLVGLAKL